MLGTPAYDGRVDVGYAYSMLRSVQACQANGIALHPVWWPGEALVQHARNMLVKMALEAKVDALLFVDSDQEWEPENVLALLKHPVDVVGAPVPKKSDVEDYNVRVNGGHLTIDQKTGLWRVAGVGTGFLKLSIRALVALWTSAAAYSHGGHDCRMIFDVGIQDGRLIGEDFVLCEKLDILGIPIHVDPSFTVAHRGTKTWRGDFRKYVDGLSERENKAVAS